MADGDKFSWHEALDRTNVVSELFDATVLQHPVIQQNPDLLALAKKASGDMGALYIAIGIADPHWR